MCPATPKSVTSGLHNIMISIGSFLSLLVMGIVSLYGWYPRTIKDDTEYLKNHKVAYFYWLLSGIVLTGVFFLILIGYCFDIGVRRSRHHHHHHHLQNENAVVSPTSGSFVGDVNSTEHADILVQT